MAARALWKGTIIAGTARVPVKLYAAVQDTSIHLHLLDRKTKHRIHEKMVNPRTGKVVPNEEIERAFDEGDGTLVIMDKDELAKAKPKESRDIRIEEFLETGTITHQWYERAYYLGPDGAKSTTAYFALAAALRKQDKEGLARWVMRGKEYVGALRPEGDYLMLISLRHAFEVIPATELPSPTGKPLTKKEIDMAKQLVAAMESDFDITQYHDEYRDRVLELVHAKAKGKVVRFPTAPRKRKGKSLSTMLSESLAVAKSERKSA